MLTIRQLTSRIQPSTLHSHALGFIGFNFLAYGLYKYLPGPQKLKLRKNFIVEPGSNPISFFTTHLIPTSFFSCLASSYLAYTIGNRHIWKYGAGHFWKIAVLGALGGSLVAQSAQRSEYSGTLASAASITFYNAIKNPAWFYYGTYPTAALMLWYVISQYDLGVGGGMLAAYSAFLFAL